MKKLLFVFVFAFVIHAMTFGQEVAKLYTQFEYVVVKGKILTRAENPVPNVKVNIFQERDGTGVFGNINTMNNQGDTTKMPKISWTRTNENGEFVLKGVPTPGSYFIEIKGVDGFKNVQYPLRIDTGTGFEIDYIRIYLDKYFKIDSKTKKQLKNMNTLFEKGEYQKSAELAKVIIQSESRLPDPYVVLGNFFLKNKNSNEALKNFEKAISNGVDNVEIYRTAAKLSFQLKDLSKVISYLVRGSSQGLNKDIDYYQMLFQAYYLSGDKENAKKTLGEMLNTHKEFKNRDQLSEMVENMK